MEAKVVVGLGFGDEGKGNTTDFLCSLSHKKTIVVRFSGGQQCGHTVVTDHQRHVHSNYGSGTLRGIPSYFSEHCTIYPPTIMREKEVLAEKGITPILTVHPLAKLTTPFDVAYNRVDEKYKHHSTCGVGIGATMHRHNTTGYKIFAADLLYPEIAMQKLEHIHQYYYSLCSKDGHLYLYKDEVEEQMAEFRKVIFGVLPFDIADYEKLSGYKNIIFEGSQGIMLDMNHGVYPHVTYAETTSKNALDICKQLNLTFIPEIYYVTRCYQTRHGKGWMSNDKRVLLSNEGETNVDNKWQGEFRIRELDYDMINYSLYIDSCYHKNFVHTNLVVTCCDQRQNFKFDIEKIKAKFDKIYFSYSDKSDKFILQ